MELVFTFDLVSLKFSTIWEGSRLSLTNYRIAFCTIIYKIYTAFDLSSNLLPTVEYKPTNASVAFSSFFNQYIYIQVFHIIYIYILIDCQIYNCYWFHTSFEVFVFWGRSTYYSIQCRRGIRKTRFVCLDHPTGFSNIFSINIKVFLRQGHDIWVNHENKTQTNSLMPRGQITYTFQKCPR